MSFALYYLLKNNEALFAIIAIIGVLFKKIIIKRIYYG